jgi:hypothetical protein
MHVTAQSTNLESVPATNNQQQQSSSALELHSNRNNQKKPSVASNIKQQQDGTTNLDDEVSVLLYNLCIVLSLARACVYLTTIE